MNPIISVPVSLYLRLIDYSKGVLTSNGTTDSKIADTSTAFDANNPQFLRITSYTSSVEQTLNIGSQSTGAGAGKIVFNALQITKYLDAVSPILLQKSAAGTPYKSAEIIFVNAQNIVISKQIYKLAAVKSVAWTSDDNGIIENVAFEYGGQFMLVNKFNPDGKLNGVSQAGWNRVRNVSDNDPESIIQ